MVNLKVKYMTKTERTSLAGLVKDLAEWMEDSSGFDEKNISIVDLIEDNGDIYEVIVVIHLMNGEQITLRNHCYESFTGKRYCGDVMFYQGRADLSLTIEDDDYIEIDIVDSPYLRFFIPLSSICYIETRSVDLNWSNLYKYRRE